MNNRRQRELDVVIFGATGFTGELVAEHLLTRGPADLRWAIAGRSRPKLEQVRDRLASIDPRAADLPIIVADSNDRASLDEMAAQTAVVATTVGPYVTYGHELVAACVAARTDYCDITGEANFVRKMIDSHHDDALEREVRIVSFCGFDSIPSDLGAHAVQTALREATGRVAESVRTDILRIKGQTSGGTLATMGTAVDMAMADPEERRVFGSPYSLNPPDARRGPRTSPQKFVARGPYGWTAPFFMATVNEKVVRRSNALLRPENRPFEYAEVVSTGQGAAGAARAAAVVGLLGAAGVGVGVKPLRKLLVGSVLPEPGEGPTREQMDAGRLHTRSTASVEGVTATCDIRGNQDPGYGLTSLMLAQTALALAFDEPEPSSLAGGILTPATALGSALIDRLHAAGLTFQTTTS